MVEGPQDRLPGRKLPEPLSYTIEGVMHVTGLGRSLVYKKIAEGVLLKRKIGRRTLVCAQSVRAMLDGAA